jgi:hypothetical protein
MRYLFLIVGAGALALGVSPAQTTPSSGSSGGGMQQVPIGQVFKNFIFPDYENGKLKATLSASEAKGITQNRAEAVDLVIKLYDNGTAVPTTTITSPKADLLMADHKMRTKNTVRVERSDMTATSQTCDFDQLNKKYTMRTNVRVLLKNFDAGAASKPPASTATPATAPAAKPPIPPREPNPKLENGGNLLDSPGSVSDPNAPPLPQPSNDSK